MSPRLILEPVGEPITVPGCDTFVIADHFKVGNAAIKFIGALFEQWYLNRPDEHDVRKVELMVFVGEWSEPPREVAKALRPVRLCHLYYFLEMLRASPGRVDRSRPFVLLIAGEDGASARTLVRVVWDDGWLLYPDKSQLEREGSHDNEDDWEHVVLPR